MYKNLADFVTKLEKEGELIRIKSPVSTELEIAEITDRISKSPLGGKALLFENTDTHFPVLTNMMGSQRRMAMALGVENLDEIRERIAQLFKDLTSPKNGISDKLKMLPKLATMSEWLPRRLSKLGDCQSFVMLGDNVDLNFLPILKCWPADGGRFVTLPLVHTVDPDSGSPNVGMYRMQVLSDTSTGMHWHVHKTGARHFRAYQKRKEIMPVTVCLGGDPAITYAATAPMPDNMDEYLLAGFLRQKPVKLVKSLTNDIWIPNDCDFVIEGYVDYSQETVTEGPFGDHTGFYSLEDQYPEFHVTAITHRKDAIYPATLVGIPPQEDAYIAEATEKIFLEPIRLALQPEICDMYMPKEGVAHNLALLSIEQSYAGQAKKVASSMWGAGQMMFNKMMVLVDRGVDVRNTKAISDLIPYINIKKDVFFSSGVYDVLDHATANFGEGGKIAFDLSQPTKFGELDYDKDCEKPSGAEQVDLRLVDRWRTVLLICDDALKNENTHNIAQEFINQTKLEGIKAVVIISAAQNKLSDSDLLWQITANIEPSRDVFIHRNILVGDARSKISASEDNPSRWPNVVAQDLKTIEMVDQKWAEYGCGEFIESPSRKFRMLSYGEKAQK